MIEKNHRKHTLNLREGDWDYLSEVFRPHGIPVAVVIRRKISAFVDELRRKEGPVKLDLGESE
jgi:hypothetical protein